MSPNFVKNNNDMLEAASRCIGLRQYLPALVLLYSHIDSLAWAGSSKQKNSNRRTFESWVSRWLLPELLHDSPNLTATDLYAARCGILHTLTSKSDLSGTGVAKQIIYAWGNAEARTLDEALASTPLADQLATLHCNALLSGLRKALTRFLEFSSADPELLACLEAAAGQHFMNMPVDQQKD